MAHIQVLVATADRMLATQLIAFLSASGMICDYGHNARVSLSLAEDLGYDVILLDAQLPHSRGLHVCQHLRASGQQTPIMMLSGSCHLQDKLNAFDAGADDFLCLPYNLIELRARLQVLSQRRSKHSNRLNIGDLQVHFDSYQAWRAGELLHLSPTIWKLLAALVRAAPRTASRAQLERAVWGDHPPEGNTLNVHVHYLRKTLGHHLIQTIRGAGFRLALGEEND